MLPPTGYSGTPLSKKLGYRDSSRVYLSGAPSEFTRLVESLPQGVRFVKMSDAATEIVHVFVTDRAKRVINILRSMHGGKDYVATFGHRQRGSGPYADQIGLRFRLALKRLGMERRHLSLRTDLFQPPTPVGSQLTLL